jgi:hypothetical protein
VSLRTALATFEDARFAVEHPRWVSIIALRSLSVSDPVGVVEISERMGVRPQTVAMWRYRGLLPDPRWSVSRQPAWDWDDIIAWAQRTGRHVGGRT